MTLFMFYTHTHQSIVHRMSLHSHDNHHTERIYGYMFHLGIGVDTHRNYLKRRESL